MKHGFIKVAAASPVIRVADADYNAERIIECIKAADEKGVKLLVFPELSLTGCTVGKIVSHNVMLKGATDALLKIVEATKGIDMLVLVGLPVAAGSRLYSCAAAVCSGELLGLVPREEVGSSPFACPDEEALEISVGPFTVPLYTDLLFESRVLPGLSVAVELGADMDSVTPPSLRHALSGATIVAQMASFPETVSSRDEAELNIRVMSKRLRCGVVMAAPGKGESSTDNVYSGLCLVAENGQILAADEQEDSLAISEIDVDYMMNLRRSAGSFDLCDYPHICCPWGEKEEETVLSRNYPKLPHLPENSGDLPAYCRRMLDIQVSGLIKRMSYAGLTHCVVGISGGVDSTLAVLVCSMAVKKMGLPSENVVACTLPCFGTSSRTKNNAVIVAERLGCDVRVIDISASVYQHFDDIGHDREDYSIAFENAQARERTQVLMDIANKVNGLNVGTEDLSEYIDGWCTYNGDHTSMYDVNLGLTKTQVRANVRYIAENAEDNELKARLYDVLDCPVTPELLPIKDDMIEQKSEDAVGSYDLQDFFTHMILIRGFTPEKTMRLAKLAYGGCFTDEELVRWLTSYCKRLFSQQFKRSCLMDGPAVEAFSVSPRLGVIVPSDAEASLFLKNIPQA